MKIKEDYKTVDCIQLEESKEANPVTKEIQVHQLNQIKERIFVAYQWLDEVQALFEKKQDNEKISGRILIDTYEKDKENLQGIIQSLNKI